MTEKKEVETGDAVAYVVRFYQEMMVTLGPGQAKGELETAASAARDARFQGFKLLVEKSAAPGDGRWLLADGNFVRVPLPITDIPSLRVLAAEDGEVAALASEKGRVYVYLPTFPQAAIAANNLNLQYIVSSSVAGIWMDMQYFQQFMQAQMQAQAQAQMQAQQAQQARAQGQQPRNGMSLVGGRPGPAAPAFRK